MLLDTLVGSLHCLGVKVLNCLSELPIDAVKTLFPLFGEAL